MSRFKEGDKVELDISQYKYGVIVGVSNHMNSLVYEVHTGTSRFYFSSNEVRARSCTHELIYHDKKEEYYCPFCE